MRSKNYETLDCFRLIAAFLVIAIHVSPLSCWNENIDYLITYCFGRIAVPFFFMVTGYFVIAPYVRSGFKRKNKILKFFIKTVLLYCMATILYIPINLYAGNFLMNLWDLIKALVFDGTFYHLWYFPSVITGCVITIKLCKRGMYNAIGIALILYTIGLLGDSYFGIVNSNPILSGLYSIIFFITDYTRNGFFFAPVFLLLGVIIALQKGGHQFRTCLIGVLVSLLFMLLEGYMTYFLGWQRHNSMYLFLVPTMYFLFHLLLQVNCNTHINHNTALHLRKISGVIYIIHPFIIVLIRGIAKYTSSESMLIENTFVQYIFVVLISTIVAGVICFILERRSYDEFERKSMD